MAFIQTIAFKTTRIREMKKLLTEFSEQRGDAQVPGFRGTRLLRDRDEDDVFLVVADFVSYDLAMANSARPDTDAFAKRMTELAAGPLVYGNYDLIQNDAPVGLPDGHRSSAVPIADLAQPKYLEFEATLDRTSATLWPSARKNRHGSPIRSRLSR